MTGSTRDVIAVAVAAALIAIRRPRRGGPLAVESRLSVRRNPPAADQGSTESADSPPSRVADDRLDRRPQKIALNLLLDTVHDFIAARD
jgi:hypothetical protein